MLSRLLMRMTFRRPPPVVSVVRLSGVIGRAGMFGGRMNLETVGPILQRAFRQPGLKAVALEINSPGGSAAQSALIHNRIRALAAERDVPVMAFVEDVAASGGYWLAAAADEIFVDDNSIVGSIGVIYSGFGFQEAIGKLGVRAQALHRRREEVAAGPLPRREPRRPRPPSPGAGGNSRQLQGPDPRAGAGRGSRMTRTFSAASFWLGSQAIRLGLADGVGDIRSVLRERYGRKVIMRKIGRRRGWLARRLGPGMFPGGDGEDAGSLAGELPGRNRGPAVVVPLRALSASERALPRLLSACGSAPLKFPFRMTISGMHQGDPTGGGASHRLGFLPDFPMRTSRRSREES